MYEAKMSFFLPFLMQVDLHYPKSAVHIRYGWFQVSDGINTFSTLFYEYLLSEIVQKQRPIFEWVKTSAKQRKYQLFIFPFHLQESLLWQWPISSTKKSWSSLYLRLYSLKLKLRQFPNLWGCELQVASFKAYSWIVLPFIVLSAVLLDRNKKIFIMWKKLELSSSFGPAGRQQLMKSDGCRLPESAGVPVLSANPASTTCEVVSDRFSSVQPIGFFWMISSHLCLCEGLKHERLLHLHASVPASGYIWL